MKILKNLIVESRHQKPILTDVFYKENHQPKRVLIFCHGYKGFKDWGAWNLMAKSFANAGFFFIKFNFSHNGGTIEQPLDFPDLEAFGNNNYTKELDDLETIIDWIFTHTDFKNEINKDNISLLGHSRGGGIVLLKANEDSRIKNVITLAAVSNFAKRTATIGNLEEWKKNGVKFVLNSRTKQQMPHFYQFYEDFKQNEDRLNIKKATQSLKIPHLIIHGNQDTSVLIGEAENLKSWNTNAVYKIIKNANHVFNVAHPWKKECVSKELATVVNECINFIR